MLSDEKFLSNNKHQEAKCRKREDKHAGYEQRQMNLESRTFGTDVKIIAR